MFFSRIERRWTLKILGCLFVSVMTLHYITSGIVLAWNHPSTAAFIEKLSAAQTAAGKEKVLIPIESLLKSPLSIKQTDPWLVKKIRDDYLVPPSDKSYNLTKVMGDAQRAQAQVIRGLFKNQREGFFVECGAKDGELHSYSLILEKSYGWRGAVIEGNPNHFRTIRSKNRKAWMVQACLSPYHYPIRAVFKGDMTTGMIKDFPGGASRSNFTEVQCFPTYSILLALNRTDIDFFKLDVAGDELKVLKTIPWENVNIKTLGVTYTLTTEGKTDLRKYLMTLGYNLYRSDVRDYFFIKKDLAT